MSEPTLKPCPWCAQATTRYVVPVRDDMRGNCVYAVFCMDCKTTGPEAVDRVEAIAAWNRRHLSASGHPVEAQRGEGMTTVADAVFGTRHNCRCEDECQAASYMARGETFRCRLSAR